MPLIDIKRIRTDGGTQIRVKKNDDAIADYTEAYIEDVKMPPVEVVYDGTDHWLWDGFHRLDAAIDAGKRAISVNIQRGTLREAIALAIGANSMHGIRRTNEDKLNAVKTMLEDSEWAQLSNVEIAKRCGVTRQMVDKRRSGSEEVVKVAPKKEALKGKPPETVAGGKPESGLSENGQSTSETAGENFSDPGPVTTKKPKVEPLGNVENIVRERDDLAQRCDELAVLCEELMAEVAERDAALEAGDEAMALRAETKKLRAQIIVLEERVTGLMTEKNEAVRAAKHWQRKAKA